MNGQHGREMQIFLLGNELNSAGYREVEVCAEHFSELDTFCPRGLPLQLRELALVSSGTKQAGLGEHGRHRFDVHCVERVKIDDRLHSSSLLCHLEEFTLDV